MWIKHLTVPDMLHPFLFPTPILSIYRVTILTLWYLSSLTWGYVTIPISSSTKSLLMITTTDIM